MAIQELIWSTRPDLIIETGVAHGGSLVFYASLLELLGEGGRALGIERDLRLENRREIDRHPLRKRISLIEGCSVDAAVLRQVAVFAQAASRVLVVLDSNHTHEHVLRELHAYSPLVTLGSYLIVLDTAIEQLPEDTYPNRPWGRGNNPHTAVRSFLQQNPRFEVDRSVDEKIVISVAPGGYLRRAAEEPSPVGLR
jgi:cephalosporin hydroxylase